MNDETGFAPATYRGRKLVYEVVVKTANQKATSQAAMSDFDSTISRMLKKMGWIEIRKGVERKNNGLIAVGHYAQYQ
jgi:hypothetical protein